MRFHTPRSRLGKRTDYVLIGAGRLNFIADKEAQKIKCSFYGSIDAESGRTNAYWNKMMELNQRAVVEKSIYIDKYKVRDDI